MGHLECESQAMRHAPSKPKPTKSEAKPRQKRMVDDETISSEIQYVFDRMDGNTPPLPPPGDEDLDEEAYSSEDEAAPRPESRNTKPQRPIRTEANGATEPKGTVEVNAVTKRVLPGAFFRFLRCMSQYSS